MSSTNLKDYAKKQQHVFPPKMGIKVEEVVPEN
jgi:hypothetical protein